MSITTQSPVPAQDGSFLNKATVVGGSVDFVHQSVILTGSVTLNPTGDSINFDFAVFSNYLDIHKGADNGPIIGYDNVVAWCYTTYYVDGVDAAHVYQEGSSVVGATSTYRHTMNIQFDQQMRILPNNQADSHQVTVHVKNNDSNSHVVYVSYQWKLVTTI